MGSPPLAKRGKLGTGVHSASGVVGWWGAIGNRHSGRLFPQVATVRAVRSGGLLIARRPLARATPPTSPHPSFGTRSYQRAIQTAQFVRLLLAGLLFVLYSSLPWPISPLLRGFVSQRIPGYTCTHAWVRWYLLRIRRMQGTLPPFASSGSIYPVLPATPSPTSPSSDPPRLFTQDTLSTD